MYNYNVVFERDNRSRFWTSFNSEEEFKVWYDREKAARLTVVDRGVTDKRAIELCKPPEVREAAFEAIFHGRHF